MSGQGSFDDPGLPGDLAAILGDLIRDPGDPRRIWYRRALGFSTRVEFTRGLILGGAHSPLFLRGDHPADPVTRRVPAALVAARVRLAVCSGAAAPLERWLPLLEAAREAGEALLIVTGEAVADDLLETLLVNCDRRALMACAVLPAGGRPDRLAGAVRGDAPDAWMREELPRFELALVRRDASVLLEGPEDARPDTVAVVHVGGADVRDVVPRLEAFARAVGRLACVPTVVGQGASHG